MSDGGENVRRVQEYLHPFSEHQSIGFTSLWNVHRYGTSRVHGERMCLTIKLFWLTSALISFHNIAVLQRVACTRAEC